MSDNTEPKNPFGPVQDKSLEPLADEVKDAGQDDAPAEGDEPAAEPDSNLTVPVKMLHHGSHKGEALIPGRQYELPRNVVVSLVANKRAVRV